MAQKSTSLAQKGMTKGVRSLQWLLSVAAAVAFIAGYVISLIGGIWWPDSAGIIVTLVIMGLIVGFLNITGREIIPYLVAAIALVLVGNTDAFTPLNQVVDGLGERTNDIVHMMAIFTAPAAVVQAIRAGIVLAKPGDLAGDDSQEKRCPRAGCLPRTRQLRDLSLPLTGSLERCIWSRSRIAAI